MSLCFVDLDTRWFKLIFYLCFGGLSRGCRRGFGASGGFLFALFDNFFHQRLLPIEGFILR